MNGAKQINKQRKMTQTHLRIRNGDGGNEKCVCVCEMYIISDSIKVLLSQTHVVVICSVVFLFGGAAEIELN